MSALGLINTVGPDRCFYKFMKQAISIITASYNNSCVIQRCIDSVREQTFSQIEHIIVDGASRDGTVEMIKKNAYTLSWWISEPDTGIYQAWNKALAHAKGEWLLFLGADDMLTTPHVIEKIVPYLEKAYPHHRIVYGQINPISASGATLQALGAPWDTYKNTYEHGRIKLPPHPGTFHHRSLFKEKRFDESLRIAGDSEFLIQELKKRPAMFVPEVITDMAVGGISGSPQNALLRWRECRYIMKRHQLKVPAYIIAWQRIKNLSEFAIFLILPVKIANKLLDALQQLLGKEKRWT